MKLLLADDHDLILETLSAFLAAKGEFHVDTCGSLDSACADIADGDGYDLVLLDYSMPGMNGLDGLEKALEASKGRPVAIMSGTADKTIAREAIDRGAIGFLPKTMKAASLANAVKFMAMGETYIPHQFLEAAEEEKATPFADLLSDRERQVLGYLCGGLANKEIARELDLQEVTIKLHVKTLCRKLGARNRTHAAMIGKEAGIA